jgi:uncharacterized membrane protein YfhO
MNSIKTKTKSEYCCFISFAVPMLILLCRYAVLGVYPFGDNSVLITDMSQQYVDFFSAYRDILTDGGSLLHTWDSGLGMNFVGMFAFYLASPFSFIILLFSKSAITDAVLVMILLKVACGGLTFSIFARRSRLIGLSGLMNSAFSIAYALCSYVVVYTINIMWLDGVIILPLMLLCTERLISDRRWKPLLAALCYIFFVNFYIAFMAGIFCFLYFLAVCAGGEFGLTVRNFARRLCLFVGTAMLAAGICAVLLLPSYFALTGSYLGFKAPSLDAGLQNSFMQVLCRLLPGTYDTITYGTPNVFFGTLPLLLVPAYFVNRGISLRERIAMFLLLAFLYFSMMNRSLYLALHVFQVPTWFPARFSFVFCALCVFLGARAFSKLKSVQYVLLPIPLLVCGAIVLCARLGIDKIDSVKKETLIVSAVLIAVYAAVIFVFRRFDAAAVRRTAAVLAVLTVCAECWYTTGAYINGMDSELHYETRASYSDFYNNTKEVIDKIQKSDSDVFYRIENLNKRNSNDGLSLGYHSFAHYSSFSNQGTNMFLSNLGLYATVNHRFAKYHVSSPVTDSLLGIKYVLGGDDDCGFYDYRFCMNGSCVYENPYVFPLMYGVNDGVEDYRADGDSRIQSQNRLISTAFGVGDCYEELTCSNLSEDNISYSKGKSYVKPSSGNTGTLTYSYKVRRSGEIYADFSASKPSAVRISVNGKHLKLPEIGRYMTDLGEFSAGDTLTVCLTVSGAGTSLDEMRVYTLNTDVMQSVSKAANINSVMLTEVSDSRISGSVSTAGEQLIMTSVAADKGYSIYVDGERVEPIIIDNAFLAFRIPDAGNHDIEFRYMPQGLAAGAVITALALVLLAVLIIVPRMKMRAGAKHD